MIEIGKYSELEFLRETSVGWYLGDPSGEEVLLPNKYCPEEIVEQISVFVYLDHEERKIATTLKPKIQLDEFALLEVSEVNKVGAFLNWGLEKQLLVPFSEQTDRMEVGQSYVVYLDIDEQTHRLFGSNRIEEYLQNELLSVAEQDEVDLFVYKKSGLGLSVIVNNDHKGLVFGNEVFKKVQIGDQMKGYVKKIHEDKKLDIILHKMGYRNVIDDNTESIYQQLIEQEGFLPFTDKSSPAAIYSQFGISKKAFKRSIGALYRERKILIQDDGIKLVAQE